MWKITVKQIILCAGIMGTIFSLVLKIAEIVSVDQFQIVLFISFVTFVIGLLWPENNGEHKEKK